MSLEGLQPCAHLRNIDLWAGRTVTDDEKLQLSRCLANASQFEQAYDVADQLYTKADRTEDALLGGQAAGLASLVISRGGFSHDESLTYGERSQEALPSNRPIGNNAPKLRAAKADRSRAAAGILLRDNIPGRQWRRVSERATPLLFDDETIHTRMKHAIILALTGKRGANKAAVQAYTGLAEIVEEVPASDNLVDAARTLGRETAVSMVAAGFIVPQMLGRFAEPARPLQRAVARRILG